MTDRALVFGAVAAAYERYRPGYPDAVAELVLEYAARPVRTALEIGAGTGKATRVFAARGIAVIATEPDPAMLAELRAQLPQVQAIRSALETVATDRRYDLVYAAAALHWTDPATRWTTIAALLEPGGTFACFGGRFDLADPDLDAAVRAARSPWLADDGVPSPDGTSHVDALAWPATELAASTLFTEVRQHRLTRRRVLPIEDYLGRLATVSAYLQLPAVDRAAAFDRIRAVLPTEVEIAADIAVHLARRA